MSSPTETDLETLRSQIEHHRTDLGETIEALTAKLDVTTVGKYFTDIILNDTILRVREAVGHGRARLRSVRDQATRFPRRIFSRDSAGAGPGLGAVGTAVAGAAIGAGIATGVYVVTTRYVSQMVRPRSRTSRSASRRRRRK